MSKRNLAISASLGGIPEKMRDAFNVRYADDTTYSKWMYPRSVTEAKIEEKARKARQERKRKNIHKRRSK